MSVPTYPYDTAEFLDDDEAIAAYAEAVLEEGDAQLYAKAVDSIARATGFRLLAQSAGLARADLVDAMRTPSDGKAISTMRTLLASAVNQAGRHAAE